MGSLASKLKSSTTNSPSPQPQPQPQPQQKQQTGTPTPPREPQSTPDSYAFPDSRLKRRLTLPDKTPLVLVACGSFSPITVLHLQLFELAERYMEKTDFEVVGNYISPCSDTYGKSSLVPAEHRINMCALAIKERNSNIMIDEWEVRRRDPQGRPMYTPTVDVLRRLDEQINGALGGIETVEGTRANAKIMLLMGADMASTMADPVVWEPADIDVLLGHYGAFIIERPVQCDTQKVVESLSKYRDSLWIVPAFENDVSSTKVRAQIQNGEIAVDLPKAVFDYIKQHNLYQNAVRKDTPP